MMIPEAESEYSKEVVLPPLSLHRSFSAVQERLQKWVTRFPQYADDSLHHDLLLFYLTATKSYLDHRNAPHLFRLVLSISLIRKTLLRTATFAPHLRHLEIRWIPVRLTYPFFFKSAFGCVVGVNIMNRYELFDEENFILALQKHFPQLRIVKESSYLHPLQDKHFKVFYIEIEKSAGMPFSFHEQQLLKTGLEDKIKNTIQSLSPTLFKRFNEEETYKHILVLSQEIHSMKDLPQAYITLDQQTGKEMIFRIILVYLSPSHHFPLKERFRGTHFVTEYLLTVKQVESRPLEAHVFRLHLSRDAFLLKSDASLDFYSARQKVAQLIIAAIGEFRDYNGGILIKQQELLNQFKDHFPEIARNYLELMEEFFCSLMPLEKQVLLPKQVLCSLFERFLDNRKGKLPAGSSYCLKVYQHLDDIFLIARAEDPSFKEVIFSVLEDKHFWIYDMAYNIIDVSGETFFNCVLLSCDASEIETCIQSLQEAFYKWNQKIKKQQILKIGLEYSVVSLDPRIGGEGVSSDVLRLLFEGLTRFNQTGSIENAAAESIEISNHSKDYLFKLRHSQWNDGSPVTAYDFEYAWKQVLSPDFDTCFAYLFYPIYNAKEAKQGQVPLEEVGIRAIDAQTLHITLVRPMRYFLQLTAHPAFSPVHRIIDQQHPQWPYQSLKHYPCNGAFQLKINDPNQGYHLVRNPFYWESARVQWDQIILMRKTPSQILQAFRKNQIDWIGNPFAAWHPSFVPEKGDRLLSFPNNYMLWCVFNTSLPPFHHPKLRRAFAYAIDRTQLCDTAFLPVTPAYSPLICSNTQSLQFPKHSENKARRLFKEALKELGLQTKNFPPITLLFHEKGIREHTAYCLQQQFEMCLGIKCRLQPLSWNTLFDKITKGNFQLSLMHWQSLVDDPIYTLNAFKDPKERINFSKWDHLGFRDLLDQSDQELNASARSSYVRQAEKMLCEEVPILPLFSQPAQLLIKQGLSIAYRMPEGPFNVLKSKMLN